MDGRRIQHRTVSPRPNVTRRAWVGKRRLRAWVAVLAVAGSAGCDLLGTPKTPLAGTLQGTYSLVSVDGNAPPVQRWADSTHQTVELLEDVTLAVTDRDVPGTTGFAWVIGGVLSRIRLSDSSETFHDAGEQYNGVWWGSALSALHFSPDTWEFADWAASFDPQTGVLRFDASGSFSSWGVAWKWVRQ